MILRNDFFGMLGFAVRSRNVVFGTLACEKGVKSGKVKLLLIDADASKRTKKDTENMCGYYSVKLIEIDPGGVLGKRCGEESVKLVGVTDGGFAKRLLQIAQQQESGGAALE